MNLLVIGIRIGREKDSINYHVSYRASLVICIAKQTKNVEEGFFLQCMRYLMQNLD